MNVAKRVGQLAWAVSIDVTVNWAFVLSIVVFWIWGMSGYPAGSAYDTAVVTENAGPAQPIGVRL